MRELRWKRWQQIAHGCGLPAAGQVRAVVHASQDIQKPAEMEQMKILYKCLINTEIQRSIV